jgi:hypothetical protein
VATADLELIWILNQYRGAEIRGAGVILRLGRLASESTVRANLSRHLRDEAIHAWRWTKAIVQLGGDVIDVDDPYQAKLGSNFGIPRSLTELLAVTVVSERRGVTQYEEHLHQGAPALVERTLEGILKDERWHVEWIEGELDARRANDPEVDIALERALAADAAAMSVLKREVAMKV